MGKRIRKKKIINHWNINADAMKNADGGGITSGAEGTDMYYFNLINKTQSSGSYEFCGDCMKQIYKNRGLQKILGLTKEFWKKHNVEMTEENERHLCRIIWSEGLFIDYVHYLKMNNKNKTIERDKNEKENKRSD